MEKGRFFRARRPEGFSAGEICLGSPWAWLRSWGRGLG